MCWELSTHCGFSSCVKEWVNGNGTFTACLIPQYVFDDSMARLETTLDVEWTTNQFNIDNPSNAGGME